MVVGCWSGDECSRLTGNPSVWKSQGGKELMLVEVAEVLPPVAASQAELEAWPNVSEPLGSVHQTPTSAGTRMNSSLLL